MAPATKKPKLIAIVGPTASGKSDLAMELAGLIPTEIIAADSRTIYKGMDIGTAKPSTSDQKKVPHWALDLIEPGETYSAKQFQAYAKQKINEIRKRKKLPILVGGTGLYIDSLLYDFNFTNPAGPERERLENMDIEELQVLIKAQKLNLPSNFKNKRHLVRTIERSGKSGSRKALAKGTVVIGILPPDQVLKKAINKRGETIFKNGIVAETQKLLEQYGRHAVTVTGGIVYKICMRVLDGEISEQTAATLFKTADWQYARRQKTWFKKNNDIFWFTDKKHALEHLKITLNT